MPYFLFKGLEVNSGTCGCGVEVSTIFEMDVEMFEIVLCGEFYGAGGRQIHLLGATSRATLSVCTGLPGGPRWVVFLRGSLIEQFR